MERRGFLKRIFGGVAVGSVLLKADPGEVQALSPRVAEVLSQWDESLIVPQMIVSHTPPIDVTYLGASNKIYVHGKQRPRG